MVEVALTAEQMLDLIAQHRDALVGKIRFLDVVMPNGEALANCAGDYIWQVGMAMSEYACREFVPAQAPPVLGDEIDKMLFGTN